MDLTKEGACDDSRLCDELRGETVGIAFHELCSGNPPSRILYHSARFAVLSDLAPLVEGHVLIVPNRHAVSMGHLNRDEIGELQIVTELTTRVLERRYGPVLVLEHGSTTSASPKSACVSHAHFHLVPTTFDPRGRFAADGLVAIDLPSLSDLQEVAAKDEPYLFLSIPSMDVSCVYIEGLLPVHQYIRQVLSEPFGIPAPDWDWGHTQRVDLLRSCVEQLAGCDWTMGD